jgi:hypothetical protein
MSTRSGFQFGRLIPGLTIWGAQLLPAEHSTSGVDAIRNWVIDSDVSYGVDSFITRETVDRVAEVFSSDDKLSVLVELIGTRDGGLVYREVPFIPVTTLIKKAVKLELLYWRCFRYQFREDHPQVHVRFGFNVEGVGVPETRVEFASHSLGKAVVSRFFDTSQSLSDKGWTVRHATGADGPFEEIVAADQDPQYLVTARFKRYGPAHDVDIGIN